MSEEAELRETLRALRDIVGLVVEVIMLGGSCAVSITGFPEDGRAIKDTEAAFVAIKEALRLGRERNDEANALRKRHREARELLRNIRSVVAEDYRHHIDAFLSGAPDG